MESLFAFDDSMNLQVPLSEDLNVYDPDKEWERFLKVSSLAAGADPDQWFLDNNHKFPRVAQLYKKYCGGVVSSVPCERVGFNLFQMFWIVFRSSPLLEMLSQLEEAVLMTSLQLPKSFFTPILI
eukprot:TRINITY_DN17636_c0_g1_i2.p1 TRINITY_DN17636_c0_g1~~TRINITY_DN17636_c0_g1_i2.p1  ORF type:complete len:125 (-),score=40.65 TRINITY_DN17636_c0_g1_i2:41-415(-)